MKYTCSHVKVIITPLKDILCVHGALECLPKLNGINGALRVITHIEKFSQAHKESGLSTLACEPRGHTVNLSELF